MGLHNNEKIQNIQFISNQEISATDSLKFTVDKNGNLVSNGITIYRESKKDTIYGRNIFNTTNLTFEPSSRSVNLAALTDESVNSEVVAIPININGKEIKTDFVVYDSDDIACFKKHGIIMDGLLGVEFFKATKGMIDFQNQTVKFP